MGRALGNPQEQPSRATALPLRPHWPGTLLLDQSMAGAGLAVCPVPGLLLAAHKWNFFELTGVLLSATRAAHTGKITDRSGREGPHKPGAPHHIELHPGPGVTSPLLQPWLLANAPFVGDAAALGSGPPVTRWPPSALQLLKPTHSRQESVPASVWWPQRHSPQPGVICIRGVLCLSPGLLEQRATRWQPKSFPFWGQKSKVQVWAELYCPQKGARPSCFLQRLGLLASHLGLCLHVASSFMAHWLRAHLDNRAWSHVQVSKYICTGPSFLWGRSEFQGA